MNEITEIDNRVNKVLEKIKEMESAFLEIQQPRTPFVLEKFVVGQHDTLETQYQQCVLEMQVKYDNIRRAKLNKKKILFKIAEYESKNSELDQIEADILKIDLEEQERAMLGAIREFETLYSIWQSFPNKYTREDIDKNQAEYWQKRLARQAQQDIQATGRVGAGNSEALRQIEMEEILKPKLNQKKDIVLEKEITKCLVAVHTIKNDDKIKWLETLMVPNNLQVRALNLNHDNYEESINYAIDTAKVDGAEIILVVDKDASPESFYLKEILEAYQSLENKNTVLCAIPKTANIKKSKNIIVDIEDLYLNFSLFPVSIFNEMEKPILQIDEKNNNFRNLYIKMQRNNVEIKGLSNLLI
jgi:hypothetical protein